MARFLLTFWPLPGHAFPNIAVAIALRDQGHDVAFFTGDNVADAIAKTGLPHFAFRRVSDERFTKAMYSPTTATSAWGRYLEKRDRYREILGGMLEEQSEDIAEVVSEWRPDVVVCDPMMWAPYVVLRESLGLKVAIFAYVPFCLLPSREIAPIGTGLPPPKSWSSRWASRLAGGLFRYLTAGIRRAADEARGKHGLPPLNVTVSELGGRMPLYLVAGSPEFDYGRTDVPPSVHYVGPCLWSKSDAQPVPEWLRELPTDRPLVHVTEGTVHVNEPLVLSAAARGLANLPMQVVMATGTHRDPSELGLEPLAPNIKVVSWAPYEHLLPRTKIVVATGGAGVVLAAVMARCPLLIIPTSWDKPEVAQRIAAAGAGIVLPPSRCNARRLREAVERLLSEKVFQDNVDRLALSLEHHGGPAEAAELLGELASTNHGTVPL